jgi:hypothetical protein
MMRNGPTPHEAKAARDDLNEVLCRLPLHDRCAALACSIIESDPRAVAAVCSLVSFAVVMTKFLNPVQRAAIVWHLRDKTLELEATWQ